MKTLLLALVALLLCPTKGECHLSVAEQAVLRTEVVKFKLNEADILRVIPLIKAYMRQVAETPSAAPLLLSHLEAQIAALCSK